MEDNIYAAFKAGKERLSRRLRAALEAEDWDVVVRALETVTLIEIREAIQNLADRKDPCTSGLNQVMLENRAMLKDLQDAVEDPNRVSRLRDELSRTQDDLAELMALVPRLEALEEPIQQIIRHQCETAQFLQELVKKMDK